MKRLILFLFLFGVAFSCLAEEAMSPSITTAQLREHYINKNFRILIVPGHDNKEWGTEFRGVKEADINLALAQNIYNLLDQNPHFKVFITRDKNGYTQTFQDYFITQKDAIDNFRIVSKKLFAATFKDFQYSEGVGHNVVDKNVADILFGINKWAIDNKIDLVIHVHFNDDPLRLRKRAGDFSGFSIYIPDKQLPNSIASQALAEPVFDALQKIEPVSNLPKENVGIVEDQKLIAIGVSATLDAAALLIEYGYIYEPHFLDKSIRNNFFKELAYFTYDGLMNFFEPNIKLNKYDSLILPYKWGNNLEEGIKNNLDVLALQLALKKEGFYPPQSFNLRSCSIDGIFGKCTKKAVGAFQEKYKNDILIKVGYGSPTGIVGEWTIKKLNKLYAK